MHWYFIKILLQAICRKALFTDIEGFLCYEFAQPLLKFKLNLSTKTYLNAKCSTDQINTFRDYFPFCPAAFQLLQINQFLCMRKGLSRQWLTAGINRDQILYLNTKNIS